jgi:purine-binding chemotaxis protein CheW
MGPTGEPVQSSADTVRPAIASRYCLIALGEEHLAINLGQVREVFKLGSVTPVPGMPPSLVGVANLHGTVVPLFDLRPSPGISNSSAPRYTVVVRYGARHFGILIDEVPEVWTVQPDDVLNVSSSETMQNRPYISGFVKIEGRMSGLVEVSRLLDMVEGKIDRQAA